MIKHPAIHRVYKFNNEFWMKISPSKRLFNSTMVYEVINRGDIFALNINTLEFTILPRNLLTSGEMQEYEIRPANTYTRIPVEVARWPV